MKKIKIAIAVIIIITGASCKKNYNCQCLRTTITYGSPDEVETLNFPIRNTASKAKSACTALGYSDNFSAYVQTQTCEIK